MFTKSTVPVHLKQLITSCQLGDTAEVLKAWRRGFLDLAANLHPDDTCDPLLNATHFLQPAVVELLCRLGLSPKKRTTVHPYTGDGMVVSELQGISPMELADKMLFLHPRRSKRRQQILEVKALLLKADILSTDPPELPPTADLPIEAEADDELVGDDSESGSDSDEDTSEVERASSTSRATRASARPKSPAASSSPAPTVPPKQNEPKPATAAPKKKSTTSSSASTVPVVLPTTVPTTSPGTGAGLGSGSPPPDAVLPAVSSSMRTTTLAPSIPVLVPQASNSFAQPPVIANTPRTTPSTRAPPPPAAPATARIQATADADAAPSPRGAAKPADSVAAPGRPRGRKKRKEREPSAAGGEGVEAATGGRKSKQKSSTAGSRSGAGATSRQRAPPSPEPQSLELQPLTIVDIRALAGAVAEPQLSMLHSPRQVEESALLRGVLEGIAVHLMHMLAAAADGEGTADDAGLPDPRHKVQCGTITVCPASDSPITTPIGSMCVRALKERATATDRIQTAAETSTAEPLPRLELPEVTAEAIARYMAWGFVFDDSVEEEDANAARRWQTVGDVLVLDGPEGACLLALRGSRWQDQAIREGEVMGGPVGPGSVSAVSTDRLQSIPNFVGQSRVLDTATCLSVFPATILLRSPVLRQEQQLGAFLRAACSPNRPGFRRQAAVTCIAFPSAYSLPNPVRNIRDLLQFDQISRNKAGRQSIAKSQLFAVWHCCQLSGEVETDQSLIRDSLSAVVAASGLATLQIHMGFSVPTAYGDKFAGWLKRVCDSVDTHLNATEWRLDGKPWAATATPEQAYRVLVMHFTNSRATKAQAKRKGVM